MMTFNINLIRFVFLFGIDFSSFHPLQWIEKYILCRVNKRPLKDKG